MATILYNTTTGGQNEGDFPVFIPDPDFSIYSPKVSGIRRGDQYYYPTMTDEKIITNTWFFSYDEYNDVFLDNWSNSFFVDFEIGSTLLSENPRNKRVINHDNLGLIELGYPDFRADGIWMFLKARVSEIQEFSQNIGWVWFNRKYIVSVSASDFFWFADKEYMSTQTINRIGGENNFTNGQCSCFYSEVFGQWCPVIVNADQDVFLSVISDDDKANYFQVIV